MAARETRSKIINAAIHIVREQAPTRLTLDEAARKAGVSKGGVLYHFASKDELIAGMIERLVREQEDRLTELYEQERAGPYRWLRAYVTYFLASEGPGHDPAAPACLAAMALNPRLLKPVRAMIQKAMTRILSDAANPDLALLISTCLDGIFLDQAMGLRLHDDETLARMKAVILAKLASDDPASGPSATSAK